MIGFQVSVNGQTLYTVGIGELGMMHAGLEWARLKTKGPVHEHLWVGARGVESSADPLKAVPSHHYWQNVPLKPGDEVTIKVVDVETPDAPLPGMPDHPFSMPSP